MLEAPLFVFGDTDTLTHYLNCDINLVLLWPEEGDNELLTLEIIHNYVELLDQYFGSVCELDIIYNYEKAYFILDEYLMAGEILETSKKSILNAIRLQDFLQEEETPQGLFEDAGLG